MTREEIEKLFKDRVKEMQALMKAGVEEPPPWAKEVDDKFMLKVVDWAVFGFEAKEALEFYSARDGTFDLKISPAKQTLAKFPGGEG